MKFTSFGIEISVRLGVPTNQNTISFGVPNNQISQCFKVPNKQIPLNLGVMEWNLVVGDLQTEWNLVVGDTNMEWNWLSGPPNGVKLQSWKKENCIFLIFFLNFLFLFSLNPNANCTYGPMLKIMNPLFSDRGEICSTSKTNQIWRKRIRNYVNHKAGSS